jgi:hypothetical protein
LNKSDWVWESPAAKALFAGDWQFLITILTQEKDIVIYKEMVGFTLAEGVKYLLPLESASHLRSRHDCPA